MVGREYISPVNGCLLSSENKNSRYNDANEVSKLSCGYKRREMAQTKATDAMLKLLEEARAEHIPAEYVLFDSCFCFPKTIASIKKLGYDVIAMTKKSPKIHYEY
jgi:phage gp37-like protein